MTLKVTGVRRKHVPLRSCIVCQQKRPKRELMRIVRTPEGGLEIDPKGKRPGRGAYVCRDRHCWDVGLDQAKLRRALECEVKVEQVAGLRAAAAAMLEAQAPREIDRTQAGVRELEV